MRPMTLALGVLIVAACGSPEDSSALGTPPTTATPVTTLQPTTTKAEIPDDTADEAIEVVVLALDAKNDLDLDRWLAAFHGGARKGVPLFAEEILMNANQRWEIVEPCRVVDESAAGDTIVDCLIVNTDDFWGVGNIYEPRTLTFHVNDDGKLTTREGVTNRTTFRSPERNAFNRSFHQWLSDTYPDVYSGGPTPSHSGPGFDTQNSDHMLIAVDYVEEFVAQSDIYPFDPTNQ